jgi:biotin carboxyl carrier protein
MPGMFVKYEKNVGDKVQVGETVLVLEAMKMYNNIPSPVAGTVAATPFTAGATVGKGDVLILIAPE